MTFLQSRNEFLEYSIYFENVYKENTIKELINCYKIFIEKSFAENSFFNKTNQVKLNLKFNDSIIDNLKIINSLSTNQEKVHQLLKIIIKTHSQHLKRGVYYNYLKEYNEEFLEPIGEDNLINKFADSFWCDLSVYSQNYLCLKGIKLIVENDIQILPLHFGIDKNVLIKKDQLIEFIQLIYKNPHYRQERTVVYLVYIFSSSNGIIYDDDDDNHNDNNDNNKTKDKVFTIYKVIKNLYNQYFKNKRIESILSTVLEKILEPTMKSIVPIKENPINFNRYKWIIKKIIKYNGDGRIPHPNQPMYNMIVDSEEFVDFILETNDFYNIPINIKDICNDSKFLFLYDYQFKCPLGISKTFKTFELANYFEKKLYNKNQITFEKNIMKSYQLLIYRSTFFLSILNCDIESIKKILNHFNNNNNNDDDLILFQNKFKNIKIYELLKNVNRNLDYKIFNDENSRDSLLNYLNSISFKFFDYLSLKLFFNLLPLSTTATTTTTTTTSTITKENLIISNDHKINFISNKFLYTDKLLNSILSLDFIVTKQMLEDYEFNISIESVEKILLKNKSNYPIIVDNESLVSSNNFKDIKEFINYILFKLLKLLNNNVNDLKKFQLLFQNLYKHLIQSNGISSLNDLIEIHELFEINAINYLSSSSQYDHAYYIFVWSKIKYFKISFLIGRYYTDSLEFKIFLYLNDLSFDIILQSNSFKELVYKIFPKEINNNNIGEPYNQDTIEINEIYLPSLAKIGEVELFLEYSLIEQEPNSFNNLSMFLLNCNKIKEFLMLSKPGFGINWFIQDAINNKTIEIIEYLFSNLYNETIETLKDHNLFLKLFETKFYQFFKFLFENHLEFILITFREIEKSPSNTARINFIFNGQTNNIHLWDLCLKYVPNYFKINDRLVEFAISEDLVEIVQYYFEIGVIKSSDFSQYSVEILKTDLNYKYLQWVINLE
ncbi:hypothetical protein DDB_G0288867 [Dictyostelium discoideum AX4]|uniref:Uncharacterized protein n=1 Tax=Dictyostelium discoideum TaxID=44689 RepID=Q54IF4_DICDI|nr:hypothetical protein DDB_G0288867 [Dictyostelium discoideum AX4]EAL63055.1 hypothetical protein DDB_G0288867 [Dictyostelium discoideum AX4]|eukprot:XP_636523.1 hypothetical protein DDB_G0288867 [Dictyostelium discoideum AX4]